MLDAITSGRALRLDADDTVRLPSIPGISQVSGSPTKVHVAVGVDVDHSGNQRLLVRARHTLRADGDFGTSTKKAVMAFQKSKGITVDGVAGPETMRRLAEFKVAPDENVGKQRVTDTGEAREGIGSVVGGGVVEVARQQVEDIADKVSFIPGLEWLSTILAVVAAVLVIGGLAWMAWGWWKSRQTDEGDVEPVEIEAVSYADPVLA
jgi:peptidoglycan hydrolase-like protein with peptidoglycan-binding domain